jgi:hypothetical protein
MQETLPQYSPSGGIGSTSTGGGFTYGAGKKPVSVVTSDPAKKKVTDMANAVNSGYDGVEAYDKARKNYEGVLGNIEDRKLSKSERSMINSARALMQQEVDAQKLENKNYEAGVNQMGIRSGRQRYASEVQAGYQKAAVDQGISKVNDLNIKIESKLSEIEQELLDKNYARAREKYTDYLDFLGERRKAVKDIADMASDANKASGASKAAKTSESMKAYDTYKNGGGKLGYEDWAIMANGAYGEAKDAMTNPQPITQEMADQIGLSSLASIPGITTADVVGSLSSSTPPEWFSILLAKEWMGSDITIGTRAKKLKQAWNSFRNSPNLKPLKDAAGEFTGGGDDGDSSGDDGDLY